MEGFVFPLLSDGREERAGRIIECLNKDFRMGLSDISRKTRIPISTIFKIINDIKKYNDIILTIKPKNKIPKTLFVEKTF